MHLWRNARGRGVLYQAAAFALLALFVWWLGDNATANLTRQEKATGFGFLNDTAGFAINFHLIDYEESSPIRRVFFVGALNTLLIAAIGILLATILGFTVGIARLSPNPLAAKAATAYVEVFRNIPLLLQIFFWYFAVLRPLPNPRNGIEFMGGAHLNNRGLYLPEPILESGGALMWSALALGVGLSFAAAKWARTRQNQTGKAAPVFRVSLALILGLPLLALTALGFPLTLEWPELKGFNIAADSGMWLPPEFVALLLALSVYTASFIAEIVRGGILAVSGGQMEAARALGLRRGAAMRLVVAPQALRAIVPPLTNQFLNLTKNSSLAAAIAYPEIVSVFAGTVLSQTGQEIEVLFLAMLFYLSVSLLIAAAMNVLNRRWALRGGGAAA